MSAYSSRPYVPAQLSNNPSNVGIENRFYFRTDDTTAEQRATNYRTYFDQIRGNMEKTEERKLINGILGMVPYVYADDDYKQRTAMNPIPLNGFQPKDATLQNGGFYFNPYAGQASNWNINYFTTPINLMANPDSDIFKMSLIRDYAPASSVFSGRYAYSALVRSNEFFKKQSEDLSKQNLSQRIASVSPKGGLPRLIVTNNTDVLDTNPELYNTAQNLTIATAERAIERNVNPLAFLPEATVVDNAEHFARTMPAPAYFPDGYHQIQRQYEDMYNTVQQRRISAYVDDQVRGGNSRLFSNMSSGDYRDFFENVNTLPEINDNWYLTASEEDYNFVLGHFQHLLAANIAAGHTAPNPPVTYWPYGTWLDMQRRFRMRTQDDNDPMAHYWADELERQSEPGIPRYEPPGYSPYYIEGDLSSLAGEALRDALEDMSTHAESDMAINQPFSGGPSHQFPPAPSHGIHPLPRQPNHRILPGARRPTLGRISDSSSSSSSDSEPDRRGYGSGMSSLTGSSGSYSISSDDYSSSGGEPSTASENTQMRLGYMARNDNGRWSARRGDSMGSRSSYMQHVRIVGSQNYVDLTGYSSSEDFQYDSIFSNNEAIAMGQNPTFNHRAASLIAQNPISSGGMLRPPTGPANFVGQNYGSDSSVSSNLPRQAIPGAAASRRSLHRVFSENISGSSSSDESDMEVSNLRARYITIGGLHRNVVNGRADPEGEYQRGRQRRENARKGSSVKNEVVVVKRKTPPSSESDSGTESQSGNTIIPPFSSSHTTEDKRARMERSRRFRLLYPLPISPSDTSGGIHSAISRANATPTPYNTPAPIAIPLVADIPVHPSVQPSQYGAPTVANVTPQQSVSYYAETGVAPAHSAGYYGSSAMETGYTDDDIIEVESSTVQEANRKAAKAIILNAFYENDHQLLRMYLRDEEGDNSRVMARLHDALSRNGMSAYHPSAQDIEDYGHFVKTAIAARAEAEEENEHSYPFASLDMIPVVPNITHPFSNRRTDTGKRNREESEDEHESVLDNVHRHAINPHERQLYNNDPSPQYPGRFPIAIADSVVPMNPFDATILRNANMSFSHRGPNNTGMPASAFMSHASNHASSVTGNNPHNDLPTPIRDWIATSGHSGNTLTRHTMNTVGLYAQQNPGFREIIDLTNDEVSASGRAAVDEFGARAIRQTMQFDNIYNTINGANNPTIQPYQHGGEVQPAGSEPVQESVQQAVVTNQQSNATQNPSILNTSVPQEALEALRNNRNYQHMIGVNRNNEIGMVPGLNSNFDNYASSTVAGLNSTEAVENRIRQDILPYTTSTAEVLTAPGAETAVSSNQMDTSTAAAKRRLDNTNAADALFMPGEEFHPEAAYVNGRAEAQDFADAYNHLNVGFSDAWFRHATAFSNQHLYNKKTEGMSAEGFYERATSQYALKRVRAIGMMYANPNAEYSIAEDNFRALTSNSVMVRNNQNAYQIEVVQRAAGNMEGAAATAQRIGLSMYRPEEMRRTTDSDRAAFGANNFREREPVEGIGARRGQRALPDRAEEQRNRENAHYKKIDKAAKRARR